MNTNELTVLLNEDRTARLMANITRRAARLFQDGYIATPTMSGLFVQAFQVVSPEGKRYSVKVSKTNAEPGTFFGDKCSCPCFAEVKTCKHLQAVRLELEQDAALEAQAEREEEARTFFAEAACAY